MPDKPSTARGYDQDAHELVRQTCLHLATILGDLMAESVIVGGMVPSLLIDHSTSGHAHEAHVGTIDLDVALDVGILTDARYTEMSRRLRQAGFAPDRNERNAPTPQRWRSAQLVSATIDFLIEPTAAAERGGTVKHLEADLGAIVTPGLALVRQDRLEKRLTGTTLRGERVRRRLLVCGPGAFVILKALAFRNRGDEKDAYDLYYLLRYFGHGVRDVVRHMGLLSEAPEISRARRVLEEDFLEQDGLGPHRVSSFLTGGLDDELQADVVGHVRELLSHWPMT